MTKKESPMTCREMAMLPAAGFCGTCYLLARDWHKADLIEATFYLCLYAFWTWALWTRRL